MRAAYRSRSPAAEPLVLFWDIDGTLLTTARAGIGAWEDALEEVAGRRIDLAEFHTAGLIDPEIARRLLAVAGSPVTDEQVRGMCRAYAAHLPSRLSGRAGHVMPGVREILDALRDSPDVRQYLLTGNLRSCAMAKLHHYGIIDLSEGAFSDEAADRATIAHAALAVASRAASELRRDRVYIIGDTPDDIACARVIGARSIAVATGPYDRAALEAAGAWLALDRLPAPDLFLRQIGAGT